MLCIQAHHNDPYFNLAAEEYLLHRRTEDIFFVWISKPAVITGKHQNTLAEINPGFVYEHDIIVARRLSGGGTVYHDNGNLNFTFVTNEEPGKLIDFKRFALPVMGFLEQLGIKTTLGAKNDILAGGFKISGNAGHVYKNRVLHHGTLLFDSDLRSLRSALSDNTGRYSSRAVQSNRIQVVNIVDFLARPMPIETFSSQLLNYILNRYRGEHYILNPEETEWIGRLAAEKYSVWEWIYGYSPDYRFKHEFYWKNQAVKITFTGQKGIIRDFVMQTALFPEEVCTHMATMFNGCRHTFPYLLKIAQKLKLPGIPIEKIPDFVTSNLF